MVGELRLLSTRFQNLRSSANYRRDLKECIDRHLMLMQSRYKLEKIFGFLAIWLAITCAIALCALVFQATEVRTYFSVLLVRVVHLIN